jgi:SpoVK/Ycf46/Vps4 family AAA+-type ATPase
VLALPDRNERRQIVEDVARQWMRDNSRQSIKVDKHALALLVENMNGLTASDTQRLARKAIFDNGALLASAVPAMMHAKYDLLNHNGILRYEHNTAQFADVGGLSNLKAWLEKRRPAFDGTAPQLDAPKGILLLGVQGCGKSLAARACAGIFDVPLLRLDCGALFDKFVGESERNLRESLATADLLAPCVLWVDEIEKGFAAGDADGGATRRVLGAFLTWLADKNSRVFVVATANDISALPPELIRKGRFDEIFFVDLPDAGTRAEILRIHAAKRGIALDPATLSALAGASEGFAGAEIEQAVVATLYTAHAQNTAPTGALLSAEIAATRPLEVVMAEKIAALRSWAAGRTVPAD